MNMNLKKASLALSLACLASCSQNAMPHALNGTRPDTLPVMTDRHNVKMVCGRAHGESYGFKLLGLIPFSTPSESEAVDRMYENARARGAQLEGPRQFVNTSYEESANYFIVASRPVIRVAADLVEIQDEGAGITKDNRAQILRGMKEVQENGVSGTITREAAQPAGSSGKAKREKESGIGDLLSAPFRFYGNILNSIFGA